MIQPPPTIWVCKPRKCKGVQETPALLSYASTVHNGQELKTIYVSISYGAETGTV